MKRINSFLLILPVLLLAGNTAFSQPQRILGGTQLDLDNNAGAHVFLTNALSSLGINAAGILPNTCALLDLSSTTKGLLVPRMTAAQELLLCGGTPPTGLIVYNTTTNTLDVYNGTAWGSAGWSLTGNTGTNPALNFLGTTDNQPLIIKTNGITRATFAGTPGTILTLNGAATTTGGLTVDLATNPVGSPAKGIVVNVTGQLGADVTGIIATTTSSNNVVPASIAGNILYSGSGLGSGISGAAFASGIAGGEAWGGFFSAFGSGGATNSNLVGARIQSSFNGGTTGTITGINLNSTGGATSGAVTGVSITATGANAAAATGSSITVSGSTTSNTGISVNTTGVNSTGINIAGAPISINATGTIQTSGNLSVSGTSTLGAGGSPINREFIAEGTLPAFTVPAGGDQILIVGGLSGLQLRDVAFFTEESGVLITNQCVWTTAATNATNVRVNIHNFSVGVANIVAGTVFRVTVIDN